MISPFNSFLKTIDNFLKKNDELTHLLVQFFDCSSRVTHFFLFNIVGYFSLIVALFIVPVYYSEQFMDFLIGVIKQPLQLASCFMNLPLALGIVLSFLIFFIELVFICTFLSLIPLVKEKMIKKYSDPLILKKRGYNIYTSSLRRVTTLGIPAAAAIIVAGDVSEHAISVQTIIKANQEVWEAYRLTKDKKLLDKLQKIPTNGFTTKVHEATVGFVNYFVSWKFGSKTKD